MVECDFHSQLPAYHDGELDHESARLVGEHLPCCAACRDELSDLARLTRLFAAKSQVQMLPLELARLHQHLEKCGAAAAENDAPALSIERLALAELLRTAGMLSALAASILVISAVWLSEFPSRPAATLSPGVAVVPASDLKGIPAWERTALTLQVEPTPLVQMPGDEPQFGPIGLADASKSSDNSMDAQVADWMVAGLSDGGAHANP